MPLSKLHCPPTFLTFVEFHRYHCCSKPKCLNLLKFVVFENLHVAIACCLAALIYENVNSFAPTTYNCFIRITKYYLTFPNSLSKS